jgi:uncharacterized repeat protein (TIGR03803 family)
MAWQRGAIIKKALQHRGWISGTRQRAVNAALALTVLIVPTVVVTQSVQPQSFSVLYSFTPSDGEGPKSSLVLDKEGNLYGTAGFGGGSIGWGEVFKLDPAGTETVLHSFAGSDGIDPSGGLVRDKEGNLYGTTSHGGTGGGTVFHLDTTNTVTVLHTFTGPDGAFPLADLVRDKEGNLYGTTSGGGASNFGAVFKLDRTGTETVLHSFTGPDGAYPAAGLVRDEGGNLYGTTPNGGASDQGTVFKLDTTGTETVLHSFTGPDGANPNFAGLVRDKEGNLYGTTLYGGDLLNCLGLGCGVVFKVDTTGTETVLHSFIGPDGRGPAAGLVLDKEGNLYGTTFAGGTSNQGTVFKLDTKGTETVLHSFTGTDGGDPEATLVLDKAGNLYGTTDSGTSGDGTVFKLSLKAPHRKR